MGRCQVPIDLDRARILLSDHSHTVEYVAATLGVHRNTLYRKLQFTFGSGAIRRPQRAIAITMPDAEDERWCIKCFEVKPVKEFRVNYGKNNARPTNVCKKCAQLRWNELQAQKREIQNREHLKQLACLLWFWVEASLRAGLFYAAPEVNIRTLAPNELRRLIDAAIPRNIFPLDKEDIRQEVVCAILSGEIELRHLAVQMPKILKQMRKKYQISFFSLDAPSSDHTRFKERVGLYEERKGQASSIAAHV